MDRRPIGTKKLPAAFYLQDTVEVARQLIGKRLVHRVNGQELSAIICETEAYTGFSDKACHSYKGRTERTEVMFEAGGRAYVYLIYGMYCCFNITTREAGVPEAVLIRAACPLEGIETMRALRQQKKPVKSLNEKNLLSGPGRLCSGMGLGREHNGLALTGEELYLCEGIAVPPEQIAATRRINIDYAQDEARQLRRRACCLTGHRVLPSDPDERMELTHNLRKTVARLAQEGIQVFYTGGALGFDTLAAVTVLEMKAQFPQIQLYLAVPYPGQSQYWSKLDTRLYEQIKEHADRVYIVSPEYAGSCMKKRNYFMVDNSSVCAYYMVNPTRSGTAQTVNYARRSGCRLIDLMRPQGTALPPKDGQHEEVVRWNEQVVVREIGPQEE